MRKAIYAGTFDPITLGHLDVILRGARIFDELTVAVAADSGKNPLFTPEERAGLIRKCTAEIANVKVETFSGLLVEYARRAKVNVIVRGLRTVSDFEYEMQMALTNRRLAEDIETIFMMPKQDYSYVSSTNVRQIAELGGCLRSFVPEPVAEAMETKLNS